jgi:hypothetical protein
VKEGGCADSIELSLSSQVKSWKVLADPVMRQRVKLHKIGATGQIG